LYLPKTKETFRSYLVEILTEHIHPDTSAGETPEVPLYEKTRGAGSTARWTIGQVKNRKKLCTVT